MVQIGMQEGTIIEVLHTQTGKTKAGKDWKKYHFLLDTNTGEYGEKESIIAFTVWNECKNERILKVGQKCVVRFRLVTNKWNDRYFTEAHVYSLQAVKEFRAIKDGDHYPGHWL